MRSNISLFSSLNDKVRCMKAICSILLRLANLIIIENKINNERTKNWIILF